MDYFTLICGLALSAAAVIVAIIYGNHQVKKSSRNDVRELILITNTDTRFYLLTAEEKERIKSQFIYIFDFEARLSTIELITAKKDDYKFINYCLRNKKFLKEIDFLSTAERASSRAKVSAIRYWFIMIINYILFSVIFYIIDTDDIDLVTSHFKLYIDKEAYKGIFFLVIIILAYKVGKKMVESSFYKQILLREKYLEIPSISKVGRKSLLKKMNLF